MVNIFSFSLRIFFYLFLSVFFFFGVSPLSSPGLAEELDPDTKILQEMERILLQEIEIRIGERELDIASIRLDSLLEQNPRSAKGHYFRASIFHLRGEKQKSLDYLTFQIKQYPEDLSYLVMRGKFLLENNFIRSAKDDLKEAYIKGDKSIDLWVNLTLAAKEEREFPEALSYITQAVESTPKNDWLWFEKGKLENQLQQHAEAEVSLAQALKLNPKRFDYFRAYVESLLPQNKNKSAKSQLIIMIKYFPQEPWAFVRLSSILIEQRKYEEAISLLKTSLLNITGEPDLYFQLALIYSAKRETEKGISLFQEGLKYQPDSLWARVRIANLYIRLEKYEEAARYLKEAKKLGSNNALVFGRLAQIYSIQDDDYNAEQVVLEGLAVKADDVDLLFQYGQLLEKRGQYRDAAHAYEDILKQKPKLVELYGRVGNLYRYLGNSDKAKTYFREGLILDSRDNQIRMLYSEILIEEQNWNESLVQLDILIRNDPKHYRPYAQRALVYQRKGELDEAFSDITKSILLNQDLASLKEIQGIILLDKGLPELAVISFDEALKQNPDDTGTITDQAYAYSFYDKKGALRTLDQALDLAEPNLKSLELYLYLNEKSDEYWQFTGVEKQIYENILHRKFSDARTTLTENLATGATANLKTLEYLLGFIESRQVPNIKKDQELIRQGNFWNHYYLGYHFFLRGEFEEAIKSFKQSLELAPNNLWVQVKLGYAYDRLNQHSEAIRYLRHFVDIREDSLWARIRLGLNYDLAKLPGESEKMYLSILAKHPNESVALNNLAWLYLTSTDEQYRKLEEALTLSLKAVNLSASSANLDTLAEAYFQKKEYEKAIKTIEKALVADRNNLDYFKEQKKKFEDAMQKSQL